jgi:ribosomal protein L17
MKVAHRAVLIDLMKYVLTTAKCKTTVSKATNCRLWTARMIDFAESMHFCTEIKDVKQLLNVAYILLDNEHLHMFFASYIRNKASPGM